MKNRKNRNALSLHYVRLHRLYSFSESRVASWCAAILLAAAASSSAETLFRFEFNENTGSTVTNTAGTLTGVFAQPADPANVPGSNSDSPSGNASDRSLTIVDPNGYLIMNATNSLQFTNLALPITTEAWIRIPETATARAEGIVGFGNSWKLGLRPDGRLAFTLFGVADVTAELYPTIGAWTHVAAAWQPGVGVTFFLNGVESGFLEETRPMRAPQNALLGVGSGGTSEPINASIDRVRVHQAALTAGDLDSDAASPKPPLASTLVAFNFDEANPPYSSAGVIQKETIFAQDHIIRNASPQFVSDSPSRQSSDKALSFDGNDRVVVDDLSQVVSLESGDFTVQAWVKFGTQPGVRSVLFANNGPGGAISFSVTSDRHVFITTLGIQDIRSEAVIPNDASWHHIAVVHRNGQDLRFYVDGILGDTISYSGGVLKTRADTSFFIGAEPGGGLPYSGLLDRLQLSNEALEPSALDYLHVPGVIPDAPVLEVGTAISIAWPAASSGFQLQSTTNLSEPKVWSNVIGTPVVTDEKYYMLLPTPADKTFYRLVRPQAP